MHGYKHLDGRYFDPEPGIVRLINGIAVNLLLDPFYSIFVICHKGVLIFIPPNLFIGRNSYL